MRPDIAVRSPCPWAVFRYPSPGGSGLQGNILPQPPTPPSCLLSCPEKHPESQFLTSLKLGKMPASQSPQPVHPCPHVLTLPNPAPLASVPFSPPHSHLPDGPIPPVFSLRHHEAWQIFLEYPSDPGILPSIQLVPHVSPSVWLPGPSSLSRLTCSHSTWGPSLPPAP